MKRWAVVLGLGCVLGLLGGCSADDDAPENDGGTTAGGGAGGVGSGGAGGSSAGSGGSATGGSSTAGTGSGGAGGAGSGGSSAGAGGSAGAAAGTGSGGAGGGSADGCGSRGLAPCPDDSFCIYPPEADCGRDDAPGYCAVLTDVLCSEDWNPVCGCDGVTYSNACVAQQGQASVDYEGECAPPEGSYDCVLDNLSCLVAFPVCEEGQVPTADGACFGPCVPIEECACDSQDDCPMPEKYACHLSAGHCGPYVN